MKNIDYPNLNDGDEKQYIQIYGIIYNLIKTNKLKEGDTLPGENDLARYWNVSRITVRQAITKLAEDGFIYKMQGKRTTVTGQGQRIKEGLQRVSNPCLNGCIKEITRTEHMISVENGGQMIGELLGIKGDVMSAVAIESKYFVGSTQVAFSVSIIPVVFLDSLKITADNHDALKQLALHGLHNTAQNSHLEISVVKKGKDEPDMPTGSMIIVMDEVLYSKNKPIAYYKYRMDADWYRFSLDRRLG